MGALFLSRKAVANAFGRSVQQQSCAEGGLRNVQRRNASTRGAASGETVWEAKQCGCYSRVKID